MQRSLRTPESEYSVCKKRWLGMRGGWSSGERQKHVQGESQESNMQQVRTSKRQIQRAHKPFGHGSKTDRHHSLSKTSFTPGLPVSSFCNSWREPAESSSYFYPPIDPSIRWSICLAFLLGPSPSPRNLRSHLELADLNVGIKQSPPIQNTVSGIRNNVAMN